MGLKTPQNWDDMQVPQDEVTPEEQVSLGEDSCKHNSCMINQTQSYVPHGWVLLVGQITTPNCRAMGFQLLCWCPGSSRVPSSTSPLPLLEQPCPYFGWWDLAWGHTDAFQDTHFLSRAAPYKPKLLDIFLLTCLNEPPNPRGCNSLLAEKQPFFKVENLWPKTPCTPGGKYYTEMMQSERLEC